MAKPKWFRAHFWYLVHCIVHNFSRVVYRVDVWVMKRFGEASGALDIK